MKKRYFIFTLVMIVMIVGTLTLCSQERSDDARRAEQARLERIPCGDLGNGYYRNPVLVGPGSDNSVVRVGEDFYMVAGGGHLIWHSRDLVNWRPLTRALSGRTWASDITYHDGRYYIYTTFNDRSLVKPENRHLTGAEVSLLGAESKDTGDPSFDNIVVWADHPAGPWSEPVHLDVYGLFDPGHITTPEGDRYLYFNKGIVIQLTPDGLGTIGDIEKVYDGWDYPDHWVLECHCLEAPKLIYRNGYYYMASAEGGTGGPATAHMGVIARSTSPIGPWENSPYNPIVRAQSSSETWWRQGHGTLIDDVEGNWWFMYTGYENGYAYLGKQSLLLPIEWTDDGWPRVPPGIKPTDTIRKPAGENVGHGMPLSDNFTSSAPGIQWSYGGPDEAVRTGGGRLRMQASGESPTDAMSLNIMPVNHSYEIEVEVEIPETAEGGLMISAGGTSYATAGLKRGEAYAYWPRVPNAMPWEGSRIFVRIRCDRGDVSCYYSTDGREWGMFPNSTSVTGARTASLYAAGEGEVVFRNFTYRGLD